MGNATVIAYDKVQFLSTDPWLIQIIMHILEVGIYLMGVPENIHNDILSSKYIFFSHGHPDHLNPDSP